VHGRIAQCVAWPCDADAARHHFREIPNTDRLNGAPTSGQISVSAPAAGKPWLSDSSETDQPAEVEPRLPRKPK
jgi:hypothetical protein